MNDLLIKNARVISPADKLDGKYDILIKDGKIAEIGKDITADAEVINAEGMCAVPGLVDMHVGGRRSNLSACYAKHNSHS